MAQAAFAYLLWFLNLKICSIHKLHPVGEKKTGNLSSHQWNWSFKQSLSSRQPLIGIKSILNGTKKKKRILLSFVNNFSIHTELGNEYTILGSIPYLLCYD